jgi:heptosyltransferase-3
MNIILSRTDNLGDVLLTLPLAAYIKKISPESKVYFIGKPYTEPLIRACAAVDFFLNREEILQNPALLAPIKADVLVFIFPDKELAAVARKYVPLRIGTSHRWFHWLYCNKLVNLSRKNSNLHELDLNFRLLQPIFGQIPTFVEDVPAFKPTEDLYHLQIDQTKYAAIQRLLKPNHFHFIMHPKSKGSAREWDIENYYRLAKHLTSQNVQVLVTGTATEGALIEEQYPTFFDLPNLTNLTGELDLYELTALISFADGLLAASTGPLHIAAAWGINACGLYPAIRPIHPQRWKPIGKKAMYLVAKPACKACRKTLPCVCMAALSVLQVQKEIEKWISDKKLA